eukprot:3841965-Pleurochrysis_carterae.AAC.1
MGTRQDQPAEQGTLTKCANLPPRPVCDGEVTRRALLTCRLHRRRRRARPLVPRKSSVRSSLADVPPAFRVLRPIQTSTFPQLPQSEPSPAENVVSRICSQLRNDVLTRVRVRLVECLQSAFPTV